MLNFTGVDYQPCSVGTKLERAGYNLSFGKNELKTFCICGHTRDSIVVCTAIAGKRILFGQDTHRPYEVAWGDNPSQAIISLQKLVDLRASILCENHFGVYQPVS